MRSESTTLGATSDIMGVADQDLVVSPLPRKPRVNIGKPSSGIGQSLVLGLKNVKFLENAEQRHARTNALES